MISTRILGAGSFVPDRIIPNERIARAVPGWAAERIAAKTGILERRFLWDLDEVAGRPVVPPDDGSVWPRTNTDMCEAALRKALAMARLPAEELDGIFLVTVSPDELNFCHDAMLLSQRLGCRPEAFALVIDSGCGGALYMIDTARKMIEGGTYRTIAVVASNFASAYVDREVFTSALPVDGKPLNAYLSMYLFGDGAGAVILRGERRAVADPEGAGLGILASFGATDYVELVLRRGGGALYPAHADRTTPAHHAYIVNGPLVAERFPAYMQRGIEEVLKPYPHLAPEITRYYLHQANKLLVEGFVKAAKLPRDRVAMHMDRYGNTSAAGTLILLAEDLAAGVVGIGRGDLVLFAAIGAGVHYAAQLVRL